MPKTCLIFMSLFTFYCSANLPSYDQTLTNNLEKSDNKPDNNKTYSKKDSSLDYWCKDKNIIKLDPKSAENIIKKSSNPKETAQTLIDKAKEINKLHKMHPETIGIFLWYNWDKKSIDWAMQNYNIKYSLTGIKKIEKKRSKRV